MPTEKPNRKEAEDPPVKRRISKPASQGQGKKRAKRPAEIKSPTERTDQTPRKRNAEITERREQEAELEQHAPILVLGTGPMPLWVHSFYSRRLHGAFSV